MYRYGMLYIIFLIYKKCYTKILYFRIYTISCLLKYDTYSNIKLYHKPLVILNEEKGRYRTVQFNC
jgi:hypothetical protein